MRVHIVIVLIVRVAHFGVERGGDADSAFRTVGHLGPVELFQILDSGAERLGGGFGLRCAHSEAKADEIVHNLVCEETRVENFAAETQSSRSKETSRGNQNKAFHQIRVVCCKGRGNSSSKTVAC